MSEFFDILPDIIIYIVLGCTCLYTFRIRRILKKPDDYKHILTESLVVGFIIKSIMALIPFSFGEYIDIIGMIISSALIGYGVAALLEINWVNKLIDALKIRHTKFKYMWQNIDDPNHTIFIDATNPETHIRYFGQVVMYEEFERFPIIQICKYMAWKDNDLLFDYSDNPTQTVLIDTSKYTEIDIVYQKNSQVIKRWDKTNK